MNDNRTYIRLVCEKLLKKNIGAIFISQIVKLYYALLPGSVNLLKFRKNVPINNLKEHKNASFKNLNSKTSILG